MTRFDESVLNPDPTTRRPILQVLDAALDAVDPFAAVQNVLQRQGEILTVANPSDPETTAALTYDLARYRRIFVVAAGKAAAPMCSAVEAVLQNRVNSGLAVTKYDHAQPDGPASTTASRIRVVEAGHPIPDEAGVLAGKEMLALVEQANADDLVIALLSGGGSALLVAPANESAAAFGQTVPALTLTDMQGMTDALLACGATINEMNCLRKHASAVKGGQLARSAAPATLLTLALSDVIGSPLDVIASGPTVPDESTWADAWAIVEKYGIDTALPAAVRKRLQAGLAGDIPDTPKAHDPVFDNCNTLVVADNRTAASAALAKATELGYNSALLSTYVEGEAAEVAKVLVGLGREVLDSGQPLPAPACLILGGETTVNLGDSPGQGGRNQELALAASLALQHLTGITVVSLATDGTDGPTDSAGGLADSGTVARGEHAGLSASDHLRRHDAYPYLRAAADLLLTGPTQTNVNDLLFVFVQDM
ncbi:MAG: glycerate kinase [Caldilineaceae bacterium]|nr:glycerate kinase [Caldilineaceae bacterium]MDE0337603.1 glycerate kinase [Caldilineaceae bacterium]